MNRCSWLSRNLRTPENGHLYIYSLWAHRGELSGHSLILHRSYGISRDADVFRARGCWSFIFCHKWNFRRGVGFQKVPSAYLVCRFLGADGMFCGYWSNPRGKVDEEAVVQSLNLAYSLGQRERRAVPVVVARYVILSWSTNSVLFISPAIHSDYWCSEDRF